MEIFWNCCYGTAFSVVITFFCMFSIYWNLRSFKADFIFGNSQKSFTAKLGGQGRCSISVIWPQTAWHRAPCEIEPCHGGESIRWAEVHAFFYAQLHVTASVYPHNKLRWLASGNKFKVNNTLDTEERNGHCLHLWFQLSWVVGMSGVSTANLRKLMNINHSNRHWSKATFCLSVWLKCHTLPAVPWANKMDTSLLIMRV
jgi:hypothetical protein